MTPAAPVPAPLEANDAQRARSYIAELAAFGLEFAELRGRRDETNARRDLDALRDAGAISAFYDAYRAWIRRGFAARS